MSQKPLVGWVGSKTTKLHKRTPHTRRKHHKMRTTTGGEDDRGKQHRSVARSNIMFFLAMIIRWRRLRMMVDWWWWWLALMWVLGCWRPRARGRETALLGTEIALVPQYRLQCRANGTECHILNCQSEYNAWSGLLEKSKKRKVVGLNIYL